MILRLALNWKFSAEALDRDSKIRAGILLMISVVRALAVGALGGAFSFAAGFRALAGGSLIAMITAVFSSQKLELPDGCGPSLSSCWASRRGRRSMPTP